MKQYVFYRSLTSSILFPYPYRFYSLALIVSIPSPLSFLFTYPYRFYSLTLIAFQIDLYATAGNEYHFQFIAKGGGSANKSYLFQETKALLNPRRLAEFLKEKVASLGTAACPPYHLAVVIGGQSGWYIADIAIIVGITLIVGVTLMLVFLVIAVITLIIGISNAGSR